MSAVGLGRVKTPTFNLHVESPSRFRKFENQKCLRPLLREDDRENNSAHSWLVHVFTQSGSSFRAAFSLREFYISHVWVWHKPGLEIGQSMSALPGYFRHRDVSSARITSDGPVGQGMRMFFPLFTWHLLEIALVVRRHICEAF
jgi:hypothetical protein